MPVKSSARAKSRILLDPVVRRALAQAMAQDTVSAVVSAGPVGRTVVVVEDPRDGAALSAQPGVEVFVTRTAELNAAILDAVATLLPGSGPVAVLPSDLPSLTAGELAEALTLARSHPLSVVADRAGTGTTLLAAGAPELLRPSYGAGSFRLHMGDGAVPLAIPERSGLRRDVDLAEDLRSVTGPRTTSLLRVIDRSGSTRTGTHG